MAAGYNAIIDNEYYMDNCKTVAKNREWTKSELLALGFNVTDSKANFLFAKTDKISGEQLYLRLKERGVLIRHFSAKRIEDYNRITIGTLDQMKIFISRVKEILKEI